MFWQRIVTNNAWNKVYQLTITHGAESKIRVRIEDEDVWLTQKLIAELFDVTIPTVNEHLKSVFASGELNENQLLGISE